jgi:hypothetical protein
VTIPPSSAFLPPPEPPKDRRGRAAFAVAVVATAGIIGWETWPWGGGNAPVAAATASNEAPADRYTPPTVRSTSSPQPAPVSDFTAGEISYLLILDREGVSYSSEAIALAGGHSVCAYLENGGDPISAGLIAVESGYDHAEAGTIVGAAVGGLCPQYRGQLP